MKVIDLLNKIANGEEVPKKIRISCYEFEYNEKVNTYFNINKDSSVKGLVQDWLYNTMRLNKEVEILEEQQDIDIQEIEELEMTEIVNNRLVKEIRENREKINAILKWAKQLDKKIKDKE